MAPASSSRGSLTVALPLNARRAGEGRGDGSRAYQVGRNGTLNRDLLLSHAVEARARNGVDRYFADMETDHLDVPVAVHGERLIDHSVSRTGQSARADENPDTGLGNVLSVGSHRSSAMATRDATDTSTIGGDYDARGCSVHSGAGAKELFDLLTQRKADVEALIQGVTGFVAYTLVQTADGGSA